jgi:hypothetical protein
MDLINQFWASGVETPVAGVGSFILTIMFYWKFLKGAKSPVGIFFALILGGLFWLVSFALLDSPQNAFTTVGHWYDMGKDYFNQGKEKASELSN